jgi:hypothetical protein
MRCGALWNFVALWGTTCFGSILLSILRETSFPISVICPRMPLDESTWFALYHEDVSQRVYYINFSLMPPTSTISQIISGYLVFSFDPLLAEGVGGGRVLLVS